MLPGQPAVGLCEGGLWLGVDSQGLSRWRTWCHSLPCEQAAPSGNGLRCSRLQQESLNSPRTWRRTLLQSRFSSSPAPTSSASTPARWRSPSSAARLLPGRQCISEAVDAATSRLETILVCQDPSKWRTDHNLEWSSCVSCQQSTAPRPVQPGNRAQGNPSRIA